MAHAEFRGAPSQSSMFGTGLSIGTHAALIAIVLLYGATYAPGPGETATVAIQQFNPEFFLKRTGPGGGRPSGGGDQTPAPPRRAELLPAPRPEISATPNPADVTPPMLTIPVATIDATRMLPGSATPIDTTTLGKGSGPGGGGGRGPGSGDDDGPGLGSGRDGGFGGETYDVGNGVTSPQLIREVKPGYTIEAMRAKVQGIVELDVVVLPDGTIDPKRIRVARSLDPTFGLDGQAVAAVKQWRFRPGTYKNQPVSVRVRVELTFTLR
jgi:protein TonB